MALEELPGWIHHEDGSMTIVDYFPIDTTGCSRCCKYVNADPRYWENCSCEEPVILVDESPDKIHKLFEGFKKED